MYASVAPRASARERARLALLASLALAPFAACGDGATPPRRTASIVRVTGDSQAGEVVTTLLHPLVVRLTDSLGAPAPGVVVRFIGDGRGLEDSTLSDAGGMASARWTLGEVVGTQTMSFLATLHNETKHVTFRATAIAGPPARLAVAAGDSAIAVAGSQLDTLAVIVFDRFGNPTPAAPVDWSVTAGGGSVRPHGSQTDSRGRAKASWTLGPNSGVQTLAAAAGAAPTQLFVATARPPFSAMAVVAGGAHSCALTRDAATYCWGDSRAGQLAVGRLDKPQRVPLQIGSGLSFMSLVAGASHTCGLTSAGEAYCWGANAAGQAGQLPSDAVDIPTRVSGAPAFTALAAGSYHTCGLTRNGRIHCWGDNAVGQMGDSADRSKPAGLGITPRPQPAAVVGSATFVALAAAAYATCGISTIGETYCWGGNVERVLGVDVTGNCRLFGFYYYDDYDVSCSTTPVRVANGAALTSLSGSGYGLCGVRSTGELVCWGNGLTGPRLVAGARLVAAWVLGHLVCGLQTGDVVGCWDFASPPSFASVQPFGEGLTLVNLTGSDGHSCGLTRGATGTVYCWGSNAYGQLGDGTTLKRTLPVPVVTPLTATTRSTP